MLLQPRTCIDLVIYGQSAVLSSTIQPITITERTTRVGSLDIIEEINKLARKVELEKDRRRSCIISSDLCPKNKKH